MKKEGPGEKVKIRWKRWTAALLSAALLAWAIPFSVFAGEAGIFDGQNTAESDYGAEDESVYMDKPVYEEDTAFEEDTASEDDAASVEDTAIEENAASGEDITVEESTPIENGTEDDDSVDDAEQRGNTIGSGVCGDGLTWALDEDGRLFIDGSGEMYDFSVDSDNDSDGDILPPWFDYREQVVNVLIGEGAVSVGNYAFYGCNPKTISIPDSVVSISDLPGSVESINCACDSYARNWAETNGFNAVFEHTAANDIGYAATCTDTGLTDGSHCALCGEVLTAQEEIPAGGHVWQENYTVDQEATDLEDGRKSIHCSNCDAVKDEQIIPAGSNSTGELITENPAESAEENPAESTTENPAESAEENPAESAEENPAESTTENPAESVEENPAESNAENSAESVSENPAAEGENLNEGQNPEESSGEDPAEPEAKSIEPTLILSAEKFVYNGKSQKPSVTVKNQDEIISPDHYTVTFDSDPVNVGTYHVNVQMTGEYEGSASESYSIVAKKITPGVTLSNTAFTYNGKEQKPTVTVKDGTTTLDASDYTATYGSGRKNVGSYNVTVKMKGNYSGTKTVTFKITAKKITPAVTLSKTAFTYNGKEQKPTVTVKDGTTTLGTSDYTVTYGSGRKNAGTYNVLVRMKGNYSGSRTVTYKITAKKITPAVTLSRTAFTYNGKVQKPTVTVKDGSTVLTASNYTVTYGSGRKNVGIYNVLVTMKGNYSGSRKVQFEIVPKGTSISSLKAGKNTLTVNWNKQAVQTTGYQIQYSVKSDFSKAAAVTVSNNGTVTRNIGGLTRGCTYYVRIRTYKTVGGSNRYSSWSSKKTAKITLGTASVFAKTPVVKVATADKRFTNTVSWNKLSGASGYEISFKKGNGSWTVLKRANQLKINHDVTHGVYYYYRVRAYSDKKDGSRVYGGYSNTVRKIQYYSPSFSVLTLGKTDPEISFYMMSVTNNGNYNLVFYSRNSMMIDSDYASYNRDTFLIDTDDLTENHTLRKVSSLTIAPGDTKILIYWVKGDPTWVDSRTTLFYEFKYDGIEYAGYTSHNSGSHYYKK